MYGPIIYQLFITDIEVQYTKMVYYPPYNLPYVVNGMMFSVLTMTAFNILMHIDTGQFTYAGETRKPTMQ